MIGHNKSGKQVYPVLSAMKTHVPFCRLFLCASLAVFALVPAESAADVPAVITFSDLSTLSGDIRIIGTRPLTMVPDGAKRQFKFSLKDIISIDHFPENASMRKPWVFKEAGRDEKVFLDGAYPLINFKTRISLVNGTSVTGHIISLALSFKSGNVRKKLFLKRQIKGENQQKLEDVTYIKTIRLTGNRVDGGGTIRGSVKGLGTLISVRALDNAREQPVFAKISKDGGFDFGNVLPGTYDLCVLTDTHVLIGLSDETPADKQGRPIEKGDINGIKAKFPLADDFFNDRWVLNLRGNRACAKALVYKRRADYHNAENITPGGFVWHLEVWSWHLPAPPAPGSAAAGEWKIDRRAILIRHKQQGGDVNRKLFIGAALEAVKPNSVIHIAGLKENDKTWTFIRDLD